MRRYTSGILLICAYVFSILFSIIPFLLFLYYSFKTPVSISEIPPDWFSGFSLYSYKSAIVNYHIMDFIFNSVIVSGSTTIITVSIATLGGYSLSRLPKGLSTPLLLIILSCAMFPQISIAGPIWSFMRKMNWLNTYQGLILPYVALTLPLAIWIMTMFFKGIPIELEHSALMDGCGRTGLLMRIIIPLSLPGMFTSAILCFIYAWNEFFLALLIMSDPSKQTMPVGIALFQGEYTIPWGEISSASFITTAPLIVIVFLSQRRIISGFTAGAIKG